MPIEKEVYDELLTLTAKVMLAELRAAVASDKPIDPRKIKNALDLIERSDPRAFQAKEEPVVIKGKKANPEPAASGTTDAPADDEAGIEVPPIYHTKQMRDKFRKLLRNNLSLGAIQILNSFAEQDGAELIPEAEAHEGSEVR